MNCRQKIDIILSINNKIEALINVLNSTETLSNIEIDLLKDYLRSFYDNVMDLSYISKEESLSDVGIATAEKSEKYDDPVVHGNEVKETLQHISKKQLIDTLYGDSSRLIVNNDLEESSINEPEDITQINSIDVDVPAIPVKDIDINEKLFDIENIQTNIALNDLHEKKKNKNIASAINSQLKKDFRDYIGINDKFLLMRDLFSNDIDIYNQTIARLNEMNDITDAYIYMQENFIMNPENEAVKLMSSIIEQKFRTDNG